MSDNRPIVYYDPLSAAWVYRLSSVGRATRCLVAARMGATPLAAPQYLIAAAEAGNRFEGVVKDRMRLEGWSISGEQDELEIEVEVPHVEHRVIARGHMDATRCVNPATGEVSILEVKSMSPRVWQTWTTWGFDRFGTYGAQLSGYMHWAAMRGIKVATYAVINRETEELHLRRIEVPPVPWSEVAAKIALAEFLGSRDILPACDSASEYTCPYNYLCDRREVLFEELEVGSEVRLVELAEQWQEAVRMRDELAGRVDSIRDEIRTALGARETVKVPGWTFTHKAPKPARTLDVEALRAELGDDGLARFWVEKARSPVLYIRAATTAAKKPAVTAAAADTDPFEGLTDSDPPSPPPVS